MAPDPFGSNLLLPTAHGGDLGCGPEPTGAVSGSRPPLGCPLSQTLPGCTQSERRGRTEISPLVQPVFTGTADMDWFGVSAGPSELLAEAFATFANWVTVRVRRAGAGKHLLPVQIICTVFPILSVRPYYTIKYYFLSVLTFSPFGVRSVPICIRYTSPSQGIFPISGIVSEKIANGLILFLLKQRKG